MTSGKPRFAIFVALAYTVVIVYASLQPFEGWRAPPPEMYGFLRAPWPRYITAGDIMLNVVAYLPLGAMLYASLRPRLSPFAAYAAATLLGALLSAALEGVQLFLPSRIASNLDVLANGLGAAIGALGAGVLSLPALEPLSALRRSAVHAGPLGDCGLIIVALWLVIQFYPGPLALGSGDWRDTLHIAPYFPHTPLAYLLAEAGVVALAVAAIGLLVSLLLKPRQSPVPAIMVTLLLTVTVKTAATATVTRAAHWLQWLTPGALLGIGAGAGVLALVLRLGPQLRAGLAMLFIVAGVLLVNIAPENPYYAAPVFMFGSQQSHLMNFTQIVRTLSLLWPALALAYLLLLATRGEARAQRGSLF